MRTFVLAALLATGTLTAQTSPAASSPPALSKTLAGRWVGILEYRDFSEPPTSTKRVQLPTWLSITQATEGLVMDYTYDDGPGKTVTSHSTLVLNVDAKSYTVLATGSAPESYTITNLEQLKEGRGTLILTGLGEDNNHPAEVRTTWIIRRNLISWLEEVRPAGSPEPFTFRHRYTFTRADPPQLHTPLPN